MTTVKDDRDAAPVRKSSVRLPACLPVCLSVCLPICSPSSHKLAVSSTTAPSDRSHGRKKHSERDPSIGPSVGRSVGRSGRSPDPSSPPVSNKSYVDHHRLRRRRRRRRRLESVRVGKRAVQTSSLICLASRSCSSSRATDRPAAQLTVRGKTQRTGRPLPQLQ